MCATANLKCWRVWFDDGSAVLVNAIDATEARHKALSNTGNGWWIGRDPSTGPTRKIECLSP